MMPPDADAATSDATPRQDRTDYQKTLTKENIQFLRELSRLIEARGYTGVHVVPQLFVVTAKEPDGSPLTMIVEHVANFLV